MTIIDCNTCPVLGQHCASCFVPVLAQTWLQQEGPTRASSGKTMPLTDAEWDAVDVFVGAGLVNPLDVLDLVARPDAAAAPGWLRVG